jgi:NADH-quinone oxidoreductase subunit M
MQLHSFPLLTFLIFLPLLSAGMILMRGEAHAQFARICSLATASIQLLLCWPLFHGFDMATTAMQWQEQARWIPTLKISYHLGVDGLSLTLLTLGIFMHFIIMLSSWHLIKEKVACYSAAFLVMQSMINGVFCAMDSILFYLFWEGMLIPMFLSIGMFGSSNRNYASIKFFLFTFFGSTLLLIAFIYLGEVNQSYEIAAAYQHKLPLVIQSLIFWAFFFAFAIKVPMWPVHTWLPDAHTEAPTAGSVILAALMLKVGAYGFFRFSIPIVPEACRLFAPSMIALSLIAIVGVGLIALRQKDLKRLIAYSSIAHMGFVTLGCFIIFLFHDKGDFIAMALHGAIIQMVAHGFSSGALFLAFGLIYTRMHTREISDFGGLAQAMPLFSAFFVIFCLANVGLPGTASFVGEFLVLMATFKASSSLAAIAALTLILSASYTLWMVKRVIFGPKNTALSQLTDLDCAERGILTLLVVAILALGFYPNPLIQLNQRSVQQLMLSIP